MSEFPPLFAAMLSDNIYNLSRQPTLEKAVSELNLRYGDSLAFAEDNMLVGKTGGPAFIKVKTAFGFVLVGKGSLENNAFVVFRGTQYLADWLTNANIMFSASVSGQKVHDGFNKAFKSMLTSIAPLVTQLPAGTKVHCLGHSLGGALATLCAEWVKRNTSFDCYLYTFGSPRVGFKGFASSCSKDLTSEKIFRVFHRTDIVPCIPIWPFVHTPDSGRQYYIWSPGDMPGGEWHSMELYVDSVRKKSWDKLYAKGKASMQDLDVKAWLKDTSKRCVYSVANLAWIERAFQFVISKCLNLAEKALNFVASSYSTLMDRLAFILAKGVLVDGSVSDWVSLLMTKICQFLGFGGTKKDKKDMNESWIRDLLRKLQIKTQAMAKQALSHALAEGHAL